MLSAKIRLAKNLNQILHEKQMSQKELAMKSGVSEHCLCNYCHAATESPDLKTIRKIAITLEVSVGQLLKEEN